MKAWMCPETSQICVRYWLVWTSGWCLSCGHATVLLTIKALTWQSWLISTWKLTWFSVNWWRIHFRVMPVVSCRGNKIPHTLLMHAMQIHTTQGSSIAHCAFTPGVIRSTLCPLGVFFACLWLRKWCYRWSVCMCQWDSVFWKPYWDNLCIQLGVPSSIPDGYTGRTYRKVI